MELLESQAGNKFSKLKAVVSGLLVIYCLVMLVVNVPAYLGVFIPKVPNLGVVLILALALFFLTPRRGAKGVIRVYDIVPLVLGLAGVIYVTFFYDQVLEYEFYGWLDTKGLLVAAGLGLGLIVAAGRATSWVLALLVTAILLAVRFQAYLPGILLGKGYDFDRLTYSFYVGSHGIFGIPFTIACSILITFILFGQLFQAAGGGRWLLNLAISLLGGTKGGVAKTAVLGSFFFGMISGSPSANTATTGSITIPMMKTVGYQPSLAGAIEATASTGGQIMPPIMGAIAFIMAEWLGIPYAHVCLAAAIPAILYFIMVFMALHFEAYKSNRPIFSRSEALPLVKVLKDGWFYPLPLVALIVFLLVLMLKPATAGFLSILILIATSFLSKDRENRLYPKKIWDSMVVGSERWLPVGIVTATVGMIVGALALSGLGIKFSSFILDVSAGNLLLTLAMVAMASFVLGMGLDSIPMYITMAILTAPALITLGLPDIAAHLFVIYWGLVSFITPPTCLAVYVACGISGAGIWRTGANAMRLGIGFYLIPFAFALSPALLLIGELSQTALAAISALVGATCLVSGVTGYCLKPLNWGQRVMLIAGGAMLILPGLTVLITGLILIALSLLWQQLEKRRGASPTGHGIRP